MHKDVTGSLQTSASFMLLGVCILFPASGTKLLCLRGTSKMWCYLPWQNTPFTPVQKLFVRVKMGYHKEEYPLAPTTIIQRFISLMLFITPSDCSSHVVVPLVSINNPQIPPWVEQNPNEARLHVRHEVLRAVSRIAAMCFALS